MPTHPTAVTRRLAATVVCVALLVVVVVVGTSGCKRATPPTPQAPAPGAIQASAAEAEEKRVRSPTGAGRYYPGDPGELKAAVGALLAAESPSVKGPVRIVLVPHAGLPFSGAVAALAFKQVREPFERVVIVAANHNGEADYRGVSVDRATHHAYPGGEVAVAPAAAALLGRPSFVDFPAAHVDHMIEIELPFLRAIAGERPFDLVPLVVGRITREEARTIAERLAQLADPERPARTLFVFSVDLSHYYPQAQAAALDTACLSALERMNLDDVVGCDTDGTQVLAILTELAARLETTPRRLRYTNSGEVTGDPSRVVGYGAMAFEAGLALNAEERQALLGLARRAIEAKVRDGRDLLAGPELTARYPRLRAPRGAFVTLKVKKSGALRGCIGSLTASAPLAEDVVRNAVNAAVRDPRFPPVGADELGRLRLSVSVLDEPRPLEAMPAEALLRWMEARKPGVVLEHQGRRSTFLPEVWEELSLPALFLSQLCRKQGSAPDCWRDAQTAFSTYGSQYFAESSPGG